MNSLAELKWPSDTNPMRLRVSETALLDDIHNASGHAEDTFLRPVSLDGG